jgi:hypothetical protein
VTAWVFLLPAEVDMWSLSFWKDAAERAIRTAAQALLALWGTQVTGIMQVDWVQALSVAALAALSSVLMSLIATGVGDKGTPSFVDEA